MFFWQTYLTVSEPPQLSGPKYNTCAPSHFVHITECLELWWQFPRRLEFYIGQLDVLSTIQRVVAPTGVLHSAKLTQSLDWAARGCSCTEVLAPKSTGS